MPTIIRESGYRVVIYSNDHSPAHVHVLKGEGEILVNLDGKDNLTSLIIIRGSISNSEVAKGLGLVRKNQELCLNRWREIHG